MKTPLMRRTLAASVTVAALTVATACAGHPGGEAEHEREAAARAGLANLPHNAIEKYMMISGADPNEAADESKEAATAADQFAEARTAPGIVSSGAYTAAYKDLTALPSTSGSWADVTKVPYNSDDPRYRDYSSNSSGGLGYVSGRITGIAADNTKDVYAASADGGVWRSTTGGGNWSPISDALPSLSSGDLTLDSLGHLWYATGEANTGGTAYAGAGVFRLDDPTSGQFSFDDRVGGTELDSTTIGRIRFGGGRVWLATNRGIWSRPVGAPKGDAWTFNFAPNMDYMPQITDDGGKVLVPAGSQCTGDADCGATNAAYKNIVNDIAVDPTDGKHVIAALGWRSGDTYNGFYESRDGGTSWTKINPTGAMPADDIGYVTFAWAKDASKLYAINQSPALLNKASGTVNSYLDGIYVSKSGSISGPWTKIADSAKLASSGSALKQSVGGKGYGPGIQSWYNQFLQVDPKNPDHVYAGLEEIYETKDAGADWTTPGPYWNFYFPCWSIDATNTCPNTSHPDQHAAAIGTVNGVPTFFAGNDGGIYSRPVNGTANGDGHATDWKSLTSDGTMDGLQYYGVAIGADTKNGGMVVSGGMQDNGASNLFGVQRNGTNADPKKEMGSNFGGDGGDAMADPADGCRQVQEYVYLSMSVTNNCAVNPGALTPADATSHSIDPGDPGARFTAPFDDDTADPTHWIAGGQFVWTQNKGYAIQSGSDWTKAFDLGAGHAATALALTHGVGYVGWCGPCNNSGFTRGLATNASGQWQQVTLPSGVPNRYIGGVGIDPADPQHAYLAMNGFSRRFTEGPGAGVGHIFETRDGGASWTNIDGNFPDVPTNSIKQTPSGGLVVGTDLGVLYRAPQTTSSAKGRKTASTTTSSSWQRLGGNFPLVTVMDVELGPDGNVYAATHGRGIWSIPLP